MKIKTILILAIAIIMLPAPLALLVNAASVWLETEDPFFCQSEMSTLNYVADFDVNSINIGAIRVQNGTITAIGSLHLNFYWGEIHSAGNLKDGNTNNIVITQITANTEFPVPAGEAIYSFDVSVGSIRHGYFIIEDAYGFIDPFDETPFPVVTFITGSNGEVVTNAGDALCCLLYYPIYANAGGPYEIGPGEIVILDGSGSTIDYDVYEMRWSVGGKYVGSGDTLPISYDSLVNDHNLRAGIHEVELYGNLYFEGLGYDVNSYDYTPIEILAAVSGDFEPDGDVDMFDFAVLGSGWLSRTGDANWNFNCDISEPNDNIINKLDLSVFAENWLTGYK